MSDTLTALADFIASYRGQTGAQAVSLFREDLSKVTEEPVMPSWQEFRAGTASHNPDAFNRTRSVVRGVDSPTGNVQSIAWIDNTPREEGVLWTHLKVSNGDHFGLSYRLTDDGEITDAFLVAETMEWVTRKSWEKDLWAPEHTVGIAGSAPEVKNQNDTEARLVAAITDYSVEDLTALFAVRPDEVLELDGLQIHCRKRYTDASRGVITFLLYCGQDHYRLDLEDVEGNVDGGLCRVTDTAVLYRVSPRSENLMEFSVAGEPVRLADVCYDEKIRPLSSKEASNMTSFTAADLCGFLTTYRGIRDPGDAVRTLWEELTEDRTYWLDGAPRHFKEALEAYLGNDMVLDPPKNRVRSPFGWITLEELTIPSSGWLYNHSARLGVDDRLFELQFYYDDNDKIAFDGSTLQEVVVRTGSMEKFIPSPYSTPIPVSGDYLFTPGVATDGKDEHDQTRMRNLAWVVTHHDPERSAGANVEMFAGRLHSSEAETLHDPEGNAIVKMEEYGIVRDANTSPETFRQIVVRVRREIFIITFGWDSYGGDTLGSATISLADRKRVEIRELLPVGPEEMLTPYEPNAD